MSVGVVRQPVRVGTSTRRSVDERLFQTFPWVGIALTRLVFRMRPSSRLRQAALRRFARLAIEAANRGDIEAITALLPPGYEAIPHPGFVGIGFDAVYHGRDGRLRFQEEWVAEWGEFQQQTDEIIDLGDRLVLLGQMRATGRSSGVPMDGETAYLLTVSDGRLVREQIFPTHKEALEAVGLSE